MKKNSIIGILVFILFVFQSSVNKSAYHRFPPTNCTGAPNAYTCGFCHSDFAENMTGGGIGITGIPSTFIKGNKYPFSINIHHFIKDRKKFGYDIVALDALGNKVGLFGTSNPYSILGDSEITSNNPPILSDTDRTTISGFSWTAPDSTFTPNRLPITFYFCGNACNYDGNPGGDYVYNDSFSTTMGILPIVLEQFEASRKSENEIQLSWSFGNEGLLRSYIIQRKIDGGLYEDLETINVKHASVLSNKYVYVDKIGGSYATVTYRIKYLARDGSSSFSKIKVIGPATPLANFKLYPNPVERNKAFCLTFHSDQYKVCSVAIVGVTGNLILKLAQKVVAGDNVVTIPVMNTIAGGTYYLVISSEHSLLYKKPFIIR